jgi:hypothetical protein
VWRLRKFGVWGLASYMAAFRIGEGVPKFSSRGGPGVSKFSSTPRAHAVAVERGRVTLRWLLTMAAGSASDFVPSFGPWELLDDNGLYHFSPNEDHLQVIASVHGLHLPDLRKLVGREQGNLKTGAKAEHSEHWTLVSGARYIKREGSDELVVIFGGARRGLEHFVKRVVAFRGDMPFTKKKLLELLNPNDARTSLTDFKWKNADGPSDPSCYFFHGTTCGCSRCSPAVADPDPDEQVAASSIARRESAFSRASACEASTPRAPTEVSVCDPAHAEQMAASLVSHCPTEGVISGHISRA